MGDGGAEGSSAIADGGPAAISFTSDIDGTGSSKDWKKTHIHVF